MSWQLKWELQNRTKRPLCCLCWYLLLCIVSWTSRYSCSCFAAIFTTASSLIISSSLFGELLFLCLAFLGPPNINHEYHYFWSHGGQSIAKTKFICFIPVSSTCVFSTGLPGSFINSFIIRPCNLEGEEKCMRYHKRFKMLNFVSDVHWQ